MGISTASAGISTGLRVINYRSSTWVA
ncbi:hypothetical protein HOU26_gp05 [Escherichia phage IMM-002]|uniref:Uncharacterized protein n=1 Tax=Escherichia phage IMM-002 TaxID=2041760 RepID=A0A384WID0_9CAUD|nr:hypothetical protein HOU26_gp05 [Escherichia phage IMM-002]ATI16964.1 hypothetical protein [Escherichia phage IMM-002]